MYLSIFLLEVSFNLQQMLQRDAADVWKSSLTVITDVFFLIIYIVARVPLASCDISDSWR
jgi:hypothetical protein